MITKSKYCISFIIFITFLGCEKVKQYSFQNFVQILMRWKILYSEHLLYIFTKNKEWLSHKSKVRNYLKNFKSTTWFCIRTITCIISLALSSRFVIRLATLRVQIMRFSHCKSLNCWQTINNSVDNKCKKNHLFWVIFHTCSKIKKLM